MPADRTDSPSAVLERAGTEVGADLLAERPHDLQEELPAALRAPGPAAKAPGCPCGCGETELLLRARAGDARAVDELLRRYRLLARSKARSYFLVGGDREDVVQEAMIGVYEAIRDYRPDRGASFRTFAELCVTRHVVDAVKGATRHKHRLLSDSLSLDAPAPDAGGGGGPALAELLVAVEADPEEAAVSADQLRALQRHMDEVLSDLETQVLRHHVEGRSYEEIAAMLQRHVKSVDNALQRIKKKVQVHVDARRAPEV